MSTPRALIVTPEPTHPTNKGNRARILDICERLEALGYSVWVAHILQHDGDRAAMRARWKGCYVPVPYDYPMTNLSRLRRRLAGALLGDASYGIDDWYCRGVDLELAALARSKFDVVVVNYVFHSRALELFGPDTLKVLDTHDVYSNRFARIAAAGEKPVGFSTTRSEEARALRRADVVLAIQEHERRFFSDLAPQTRVVTIGHRVPIVETIDPGGANILFFGSANQANVDGLRWFAREVMPAIRANVSGARLVVAGAAGERVDDSEIDERLGIVKDPSDAYARATVVVVPMRFGTGLKIKAIEALGHGKATVMTAIGGEGLEEGAPDAFRISADATSMAADVVALLEDRAQREKLAARARTWAADWNAKSQSQLESVFVLPSMREPG